jgi:hypothetical protein
MRLEPVPYYQHQPVTAPADVAPERSTAGASPFVRVIPGAVSTAATALGYVWHYNYGAAHSIGDAAISGAFSLVCLWAGHRMAGAAANIPSSITAAAYGLGAGLGGIAVTAYANAPVAGLIAWLAGTIVAYALASTGWTRRAEKREQRQHERDMALIREQGKTQRTQLKTDAQVQVAKELGSAWAAEQAASAAERMRMQDFNERYPSSVPMFGAAGNFVSLGTSTAPMALDVETQLEKLTGAEFYDQSTDGLELPEWLTNPDSSQ